MTRRSILASLSLASLARCTRSATSPSSTTARRIVSIAPNTTEMLFALGLGERVVGVSSLCDFPEQARSLPKVGALGSLSLEAILALRPDVVVGAPGIAPSMVERLRARSIRVEIASIESIESVRGLARTLSALCDEPNAYARWSSEFESSLRRSERIFDAPSQPRVLAVIDSRPIVCAGPGSYIDELLRHAHARNALTSGPAWPQLSIETVLQSDPDVVLDLCGPLAQEPLSAAWSAHTTLRAVRNRRVIAVSESLVTRPGPRAPEAIARIAQALRSAYAPG